MEKKKRGNILYRKENIFLMTDLNYIYLNQLMKLTMIWMQTIKVAKLAHKIKTELKRCEVWRSLKKRDDHHATMFAEWHIIDASRIHYGCPIQNSILQKTNY